MKFLKNTVAIIALAAASFTATASVYTYGDFEREYSSDYSTGLGMDWMMWSVTKGMSINTASSIYSADGWRVASYTEMAGLYNYFIGSFDWQVTESATQQTSTGFTDDLSPDTENDVQFQTLFGYTYVGSSVDYLEGDALQKSEALFGTDENSNSKYNLAGLYDDFTVFNGNQNGGNAYLNKDTFTANFSFSRYGVALVRGEYDDAWMAPDVPGEGDGDGGNNGGGTGDDQDGGTGDGDNGDGATAVHAPGTVGMMAMALGLIVMRRRNK